jgi:glycosyltransferase involved in cell wall biosynthesis
MKASLSVVIPVYNERENIAPLYHRLDAVVRRLDRTYEIVFVDDGSTDGTSDELARLAQSDPNVRIVEFRRNYGQTAAMHAGMQNASGDVIVTMDGDQQNDPTDIPAMLAKIDEGYDVVHGWRRRRQDAWLSRKLPSKTANWIISKTTGFPIHDLGCTLKAIRREIAQELELYGEMHRFIPILAHWRGARCIEIVTQHHPRTLGKTKYGIGRTTRVVLDLITVKYMLQFFASPMKLFGRIGLACLFAGFVSFLATTAMKVFAEVDMTGNPLLLLTALCTMLGIQFFSLGLLGETSARIYYANPSKATYAIRRRVNFDAPSDEPNERAVPRRAA